MKAKTQHDSGSTALVTSWKAVPKNAAAHGVAMFKAYVTVQDKVDATARGNMISFLKPQPDNAAIQECIDSVNGEWSKYREAAITTAQGDESDEKKRETIAAEVAAWLKGGRAKRKSELVAVLEGSKTQMTFVISTLESNSYHRAVGLINAKRRETGTGGQGGGSRGGRVEVGSKTVPAKEIQEALAAAGTILKKSDDALAKVVSEADDSAVFNSVVAGIKKLQDSTGQYAALGNMLNDAFEAWQASNTMSGSVGKGKQKVAA